MSIAERIRAASLALFKSDPEARPSFNDSPFPLGKTSSPEDMAREKGATGTQNWSGFIRGEDYVPAVDGMTAVATFDEMLRGDAQVQAAFQVVEQPLRSSATDVQSASDAPDAKQQAAFVQWTLSHIPETPWDDFMRQALLMLAYGHFCFEKVYYVIDSGPWSGYIGLKKLASRQPKTLWQWFTDRNGKLLSIKQLAVRGGHYEFLDIPADKLVVFTHRKVGDNFLGTSMLRAAYRNWYIKKRLYEVDAMRAYRYGVGIPRAKLMPGYKPNARDLESLRQTLQNISAHQHAWLIEPEGYSIDILTPTGTQGGVEVMRSIDHHDQAITRSILAQFLDMGGAGTGGSRALGASAMGFFLNALQSIARYVEDVINQQIVVDLIRLNFEGVKEYPQFKLIGMRELDLNSMSTATTAFAGAGLITPDPQTEDAARAVLDLPPKPKSEDPEIAAQQDRAQQQEQTTEASAAPPVQQSASQQASAMTGVAASDSDAKMVFWRKPTALEMQVFDLVEMPRRLDAARALLVEQLTTMREEQGRRLAKALSGMKPSSMKTVSTPLVGKIASDIQKAMLSMLRYGYTTVESELGRQGKDIPHIAFADRPTPRSMAAAASRIKASAQSSSQLLGDTLRSSAVQAAMAGERAGKSGATLEGFITNRITAQSTAAVRRIVSSELNESFSLGRGAAADERKGDIEKAIYSAILDQTTCGECRLADGTELEVGSPEYDALFPPNPLCDGQDNCRCIFLYVTGGQPIGDIG
jgi:hypothetical protein